jgi:hypothetical protein
MRSYPSHVDQLGPEPARPDHRPLVPGVEGYLVSEPPAHPERHARWATGRCRAHDGHLEPVTSDQRFVGRAASVDGRPVTGHLLLVVVHGDTSELGDQPTRVGSIGSTVCSISYRTISALAAASALPRAACHRSSWLTRMMPPMTTNAGAVIRHRGPSGPKRRGGRRRQCGEEDQHGTYVLVAKGVEGVGRSRSRPYETDPPGHEARRPRKLGEGRRAIGPHPVDEQGHPAGQEHSAARPPTPCQSTERAEDAVRHVVEGGEDRKAVDRTGFVAQRGPPQHPQEARHGDGRPTAGPRTEGHGMHGAGGRERHADAGVPIGRRHRGGAHNATKQ